MFVSAQSMARSSAAISFVTAGSACFSNVIEFRPASRHSLCNWPPIPVPWRSFAYVKELPPGEKLVRQTFLQNFTFERPPIAGKKPLYLSRHTLGGLNSLEKGRGEKEKRHGRFTCRARVFLIFNVLHILVIIDWASSDNSVVIKFHVKVKYNDL